MQPSELIEEYLEKAVPKTVSGKKYADIRDELTSHIADKADFYIEIGYSEKEAYVKALNEMGEPEQISSQFEEVYRENRIFGKLVFAIIICADLFAIITEFGSSLLSIFFTSAMYLTYDSLIISTAFITLEIILILFAYKEKYIYLLRKIAIANLLISFPFVGGSVYYPACAHFIEFLFPESAVSLVSYIGGWTFLVSFLIFILCLKLDSKLAKGKRTTTVGHISFKLISAALVCFCIVLCTNITLFKNENVMFDNAGISDVVLLKIQDKKLEKLYDSITTAEEADLLLRKAGYLTYEELLTQVEDTDYLEYILSDIRSDDKENEKIYLLYNISSDRPAGGAFILSADETGRLSYKRVHYACGFGRTDILLRLAYTPFYKDITVKSFEAFKELRLKDSKEEAIKKMKRVSSLYSTMTERTEKGEVETYYFSNTDNLSTLLDVPVAFEGTLTFDSNGKLVSGNCIRYDYGYYDEEGEYIEDAEEYTITQ